MTQPKDVAAMADAIESLLLDDDRRIRLARRGTEQAGTFNWDASATKLEAFLLAYASDAHRYRRPPDS